MQKTWNIRDQPEESLKRLLEKKYKEINAGYTVESFVENLLNC
jgi:hypothetical protein